MTDQQGKPIRLETPEAITQAVGIRPQRMSQVSGEHRTMQNVKAYFNAKRDDLYARYRLAKTDEDRRAVIRDMQRFNMEARKYRGIIPPITMTSLSARNPSSVCLAGTARCSRSTVTVSSLRIFRRWSLTSLAIFLGHRFIPSRDQKSCLQ